MDLALLALFKAVVEEGGVSAAARYLEHPGRRPKGTRDWDVRFHASVGLARAFASGAIEDTALRARVRRMRGGTAHDGARI